MLRENLRLFFSLSILFISTNSLHLNNRIGSGGGIGIGIGNNIVASSTSDNNINDINDDTHSFRRRSQISPTSNLDYIDPRLNNRILIGEHYKKLSLGLGGGGDSGGPGGGGGSSGNSPTHKLFDDNFMKFKTTNSSSPSRHYSFGYIRNLDDVIPDIDDNIDIIDDNDYHHHRPILIGLNQQQHYHPKFNYQYGNPYIGDSSEMLLKNNEFPPLAAHFNRRPPLSLTSSSPSSSILHSVPPIPTYAMINGNRNRYEHDNYGYKINDKLPKKYSKTNDDLIDIDTDRNNDNNNNNNNGDNNDDGMINDEPYDYRKRRNNKNKKNNNNQSPPKALQELFQQNLENSISSSSSSSSSDNGKNGNNINNRQAPLDIRIQSNKQQIKMRQDQQQKQQDRQTKKQIKQNENKQKKLLQMEQLKQIKRSGSSGVTPAQMLPTHSIASQLMLRTARGQRQYDVPQIECPSAMDGMERFACPTPDRQGRYRCIDDHVLCDGFIDCPEGEDEDRSSCMFYKTTKAHLDVLADALLRWARGR